MNLTIKDAIYHFAYYLVKDEHFDIVYMNVQHNEIWVRKTVNKKTQIIRLVNKQFNWKNHLKVDIAKVFQQVKMMRNQIKGNDISIFNIYTSYDEPVDSWETLKRTLVLEDNRPLKMNVFYVTQQNFENEEARIFKMLNVSDDFSENLQKENEIKSEKDYSYYKKNLLDNFEAKQKKMVEKLKPKMPFGVFVLLTIMIITYLLSASGFNFLTYNLNLDPSLERLTNGLRHIFYFPDISYLLMSLIIIYIIGRLVERIFGAFRFVIIFLLSGVLGNALVSIFDPISIVDSSSGIFGLFGALLFYGVVYRKVIPYKLQRNYLLLLVISLSIGIILPEISLSQYVLGFVVGFCVALAVGLPRIKKSKFQLIGLFALIVILIGIIL